MRRALKRRYGHMAPAFMGPVEGFEFKFYSKDRGEPPHVHVFRAGLPKLKFWLEAPVRLAESPRRWKAQEVRRARQILEERREEFIAKWESFFSSP
ncbi:MAG TPA: DUF4160 domain-containing protein [Casimicrobiaceae bacterium]|nr:DUF4160 domain-containing protein [Casimicrobiaceae bacterium]